MGSSNLVVPSSPSHYPCIGGGLTVADQDNSDPSRVNGSNVVPSVSQTENVNGSHLSTSSSEVVRFPKGSTEKLPEMDQLYAFYIKGKVIESPMVVLLMFWMVRTRNSS